jgi:hypothetical protein
MVALGLVAISSAAQGGGQVVGSWAGEMRQVDVDRESKYAMTLTLKGATGASSYPTLQCGGEWTRVGETKDGYAIYHEKIVNEPGGTCIDGVFIARADGGKLIIGWFGVYEGAPSLASAVLSRAAK